MKKPITKTLKINLSEEERKSNHALLFELQEKSIRPIINFFTWASAIMLFAIFGFAFIEHFYPTTVVSNNVITDKVMIAAVGAVAIQSGAILVAAFRGMFSKEK